MFTPINISLLLEFMTTVSYNAYDTCVICELCVYLKGATIIDSKFTTQSFLKAKQSKKKITMLTAYDYSMAKIIDDSGIDSILVGDSLGMVIQGHDSTLRVTMDDMVYHCQCAARGVKKALLVGDMPFYPIMSVFRKQFVMPVD